MLRRPRMPWWALAALVLPMAHVAQAQPGPAAALAPSLDGVAVPSIDAATSKSVKSALARAAQAWGEAGVVPSAPSPVRQPPGSAGAPATSPRVASSPRITSASGRTSAVIDLNQPWEQQAVAVVKARDRHHHVDENPEPKGEFRSAILDRYAVGYAVNYEQRYQDMGYLAIRGREQQLIDYLGARRAEKRGIQDFHGGAHSDSSPGERLTENVIRGVARDNPYGEPFHAMANLLFGELAPFSGQRRF